ncbi:MAG: hypothetical protein ABII82_09095 [Verrucomicrobiota bacterium]
MKPRRPSELRPRVVKPPHPLEWLADPVRGDPTFELKAWFGGRSIMLDGKHQLFLTTQGEPWQGVLVCTFHEHQPSLLAEFPALRQHPVLKKWLYLPEAHEDFEAVAGRLVTLARQRDPRIGIPPSPRKKRAKPIRFGDKL